MKPAKLITAIMICVSMTVNVFADHFHMAFLFGGTTEQYIAQVDKSDHVFTVVSPDYFGLNADGGLAADKPDKKFIKAMHDKGLKVTPFLSNHFDRELGTKALQNASGLADEIANAVNAYKLDGVNIDIENISHVYRDDYTAFVKTLRNKLPDKIISVLVPANPYNWVVGWHGSYDYEKLADYCDYLMLMSYDESYYEGAAGPIASIGFVESAIKNLLTFTQPEKIVLGIPFYGRFWKDGDKSGGDSITAMDIKNLQTNYKAQKIYHEDTQSAQAFLTLTSEQVMPKLWGGRTLTPGVYDIWFDDLEATKHKLDLVGKYGLKGTGSWALGQEDAGVWSIYKSYALPSALPSVRPAPPEPLHSPKPSPMKESGVLVPDVVTVFGVEVKQSGLTNEEKNVISRGWFGRDEFYNDKKLTRAEAVKIIMRMAIELPAPKNGVESYADTINHEDDSFIKKAKGYGVIEFNEENLFYPDAPITKKELAVYLDRVFSLPDTVNFESGIVKDLDKKLNPEAYYAINKYIQHGIFTVDQNGRFYPDSTITMKEMAKLADKMSGCGVRKLVPIQTIGQKQPRKILNPR